MSLLSASPVEKGNAMSERTSTIRLTRIYVRPEYSDGMAWAGIVIGDHVFVICTEGVGWDLSIMTEEKQRAFFGTSIETVRAQLRNGPNSVLLRDFVREFGSRLEVNYWQNHMAYANALLELEESARDNQRKQSYANYVEGYPEA
jgi:hypothetical protein